MNHNAFKIRSGPRIPRLCKPVCAVTAGNPELIEQAIGWLTLQLGETDLKSEIFSFDSYSHYYEKEMGSGLLKQFVSFNRLVTPLFLSAFKRKCAAFERATARNSARIVNIDPGYWADAKLVLASTKNYSHRIQIGRRIFAELTLMFTKGRLSALEWTYPDYSSELGLKYFSEVRKIYFKQLEKIA